jgi:ABC-2 type transport system permease protein
MKKILTIAWWEYITKVRTKTFLISLILMPALIIAFGFLPTFLMEKADLKQKRIGVVDLSGWIFDKLEDKIKNEFKLPDGKPNYVLIRIQAGESLAEIKGIANKKVIAGEFEAYIIIPKEFEDSLNFQYVGQNVGNIRDIERFKSALQEIVIASELGKYGVDKEAISKIIKPVKYNTIKISKKGEEEKTDFLALFFSSYIFIIALIILVLTGGQMLVRSVVEEKSNRVVEVLLSSCNANELMA